MLPLSKGGKPEKKYKPDKSCLPCIGEPHKQGGRKRKRRRERQKQRGMEGKTERQTEQLVINKNSKTGHTIAHHNAEVLFVGAL